MFLFIYDAQSQPDRFTVKAMDGPNAGTVLFSEITGSPGACFCPDCAPPNDPGPILPNGQIYLDRQGATVVEVRGRQGEHGKRLPLGPSARRSSRHAQRLMHATLPLG